MNEFKPDYAVPPKYTLLEMVKERGETLSDFASNVGIDLDDVMNIIDGKTPITKEIAGKFSDYFGGSNSFWLNLQNNYAKTLYRLCCEQSGLKSNLFTHFSDDELEALSAIMNPVEEGEDVGLSKTIKFLDDQFNEEWQKRAWEKS